MSAFGRLLRTLRPYRLKLGGAITCMVIYSLASTLSIALVQPFLKVMFATVDPGSAVGSGEGVTGTGVLASASAAFRDLLQHWILDATPLVAFERLGVVILTLFLVKNLADYVASYLSVAVEQSAMRDLRRDLFAHLQRLPMAFFHSQRSGSLIAQLTSDVEALRGSLAAGISNLLKDGLTLLGCLVLVFAASWKLALFSMLILPPAAIALVTIGRSMRRRSGRAQAQMADLTGRLQETIAGARVVKAFRAEAFEEARFERANTGYRDAFVRLRRVSAAARPFSEYAVIVVAVAIAWLGAREILENRSMPPERFFLFVTALLATISPIKSLSEVGSTLATGLGAADRVFGLLDTAPAITDAPGATALRPLATVIRFEQVHFAYTPGEPVLQGVEFSVPRGQVVALVGASGAGKSTTLDLLARFQDPQSGRITWDGIDLRNATVGSLRSQLAVVTQETLLFHDTVRANIAYALPDVPIEQVEAAARAAHAHDFIARMPQGYDTVIGERGLRLSGGERQRLAIARALLRDPKVLLLDEATSSLDTESERLVQGALETLMRDRTTLVIAHRLSTVQHAHRILVFEHGRIVEQGTHEELFALQGVYHRLHALQFRE